MTHFTLVQHPVNHLYAVYQDGVQVKNPLFTSIEDFEQELKFLGYNEPYTVSIREEQQHYDKARHTSTDSRRHGGRSGDPTTSIYLLILKGDNDNEHLYFINQNC